MDQFDIVIVGAGSAGCVLADKLSADGRRRVLLLEAGGSDRRFWIKTPIGYGKTFHDPEVNWRYQAEADPGLGGRESYWPRGKVLGGSSSINAMCYVRGLPSDYDDWRDAGAEGWGWADVEPEFRAFERKVRPDGTEGEGPLWVSDRSAEYHPIRRHFIGAAREAGLPATPDMNGDRPEGVSPYWLNTRRGLRCSAADAFLRPAMGRRNLEVRTGVLVERVMFEGRRAVGVACRRDGRAETVRAGRVVLAAGAVTSPRLLQLSGIGPGALLAEMGIPVLHANDNVGGGLQDHLGINYYYRATEPTLNQVLRYWPGRIRAGIEFLLMRRGPLSLSVNQMGGLVRSGEEQARPNVQLYFNPLSYTNTVTGKRPLLLPDPWPGFILSFNPTRPTSRGRVDISAPDPAAPPRIRPNYLSTNEDVADVLAGARLIGRLQDTGAMRRLIAGEPKFDPAKASDEDVLTDFRARSGSVFHASCTCRMGRAGDGAVVGPDTAVHGAENLHVADASIFPNVTSGNTNAPSIMVGHRAARLIASAGA